MADQDDRYTDALLEVAQHLASLSASSIRLHAGEMTAGEMRAVRAVLHWQANELLERAANRTTENRAIEYLGADNVPRWLGQPITPGWWWLEFTDGPGPRYWDGTFWDRGSIFVGAEDYAAYPITGPAIPPRKGP